MRYVHRHGGCTGSAMPAEVTHPAPEYESEEVNGWAWHCKVGGATAGVLAPAPLRSEQAGPVGGGGAGSQSRGQLGGRQLHMHQGVQARGNVGAGELDDIAEQLSRLSVRARAQPPGAFGARAGGHAASGGALGGVFGFGPAAANGNGYGGFGGGSSGAAAGGTGYDDQGYDSAFGTAGAAVGEYDFCFGVAGAEEMFAPIQIEGGAMPRLDG